PDGAATGVAAEKDRPRLRGQHLPKSCDVVRECSQWKLRRGHVVTRLLQDPDDAAPTGTVRPGTMHEDDVRLLTHSAFLPAEADELLPPDRQIRTTQIARSGAGRAARISITSPRRRPSGRAAAQLPLQDLARRIPRERVDEHHVPRHLEPRQLEPAVLDELLWCRRHRARDDEGDGHLAP